ncbi:50S ribosomal protein L29 [Mesohalobacter halotolerans]|jgi:large subunit ribosomal protein L29|uniref:Large ribosomal subunit protein uL29 n=1 Tax=Mesohalobacter halotolerans TaxID=1883405 RepID=A0A4U5TNY3_9FLAO|nr:50S ribosomal protein L29 [Mesohalobacter halotolerans]MBS3738145.1 50S ribosomal protein L29 [Psychroflexus sp.]NBC57263.1 50S ribosomal protein L29 [Bacteroidota bacterium]TKS55636.1 50S ribosomal protein L29 [Mesohalobacter halotolerans]
MKQSEILKLSDADLVETMESTKQKITELKMAHTLTPLENPMQIRTLRRSVARMKSEISKRNLV